MSSLPSNPSESFRRRNAHIYGGLPQDVVSHVAGKTSLQFTAKKKIRVRQSTKPLMNQLEKQFQIQLMADYPKLKFHPQAVMFRLANGCRFTPDFFCFKVGVIDSVAFEVKGRWFTDDANVKLKMAASVYPEIQWWLAWRDAAGAWQKQRILP